MRVSLRRLVIEEETDAQGDRTGRVQAHQEFATVIEGADHWSYSSGSGVESVASARWFAAVRNSVAWNSTPAAITPAPAPITMRGTLCDACASGGGGSGSTG